MNEIDATTRTTSPRSSSRPGSRGRRRERDDDEQEDRADEPVDDREDALARRGRRTRQRRHERTRSCPPSVPSDRLQQELEDDPEVRPDDGADEQRRHRLVDVERPPVASIPFAMKTIVSVLATVQRNQATSHQSSREVGIALDDAAGADRAPARIVPSKILMRTPPGRRPRPPRPRTRGPWRRRTPPRAFRVVAALEIVGRLEREQTSSVQDPDPICKRLRLVQVGCRAGSSSRAGCGSRG